AHRLLTEKLATAGSRGYHYRLLAALQEFGPASQAMLGRRTAMDRSDVVAAVNELADRGLADRSPDPADRRRNVITITPARTAHPAGGGKPPRAAPAGPAPPAPPGGPPPTDPPAHPDPGAPRLTRQPGNGYRQGGLSSQILAGPIRSQTETVVPGRQPAACA